MLERLLLRFRFVRGLQGALEASEHHVDILNDSKKEAAAMVESLLGKMEESEATLAEANHYLDIERTKRIAAEQIAVARGTELDWLREQFKRADDARDAANSERLQSLDLVNTALLKTTEAEAAPSKETLQSFKAVPKKMNQAVPMMRKAQGDLIRGLRAKFNPRPVEKVQ